MSNRAQQQQHSWESHPDQSVGADAWKQYLLRSGKCMLIYYLDNLLVKQLRHIFDRGNIPVLSVLLSSFVSLV
jgi:hypothetical protein